MSRVRCSGAMPEPQPVPVPTSATAYLWCAGSVPASSVAAAMVAVTCFQRSTLRTASEPRTRPEQERPPALGSLSRSILSTKRPGALPKSVNALRLFLLPILSTKWPGHSWKSVNVPQPLAVSVSIGSVLAEQRTPSHPSIPPFPDHLPLCP